MTACIRYISDDGKTDIMPCADAINSGKYGYNNLQWYGFTVYHAFNEHWHISYEAYDLFQKRCPTPLTAIVQTIYATWRGLRSRRNTCHSNAPDQAICADAMLLTCKASLLSHCGLYQL